MNALQFVLDRMLPEDLRQPSYQLDKKGISALMSQVALKYPERYAEITKKLGDLGRNSAWFSGYTAGADDLRPVINTAKYFDQLDAELEALRKKKLPDDEFDRERSDLMVRYSDLLEKDTMSAAMGSRNAFARAVASGARGNPAHVKAILSTPGVFADAQDNIIPLFVRHSYAEGVRPGEALAGSYGARKATVATKTSTARGGDLGKIINQSTSNYNVTLRDCGVNNGLDLEADDASLMGRVLARDAGIFKAGTVIDKHVAAKLRSAGKPVIARSAMTCRAEHGLCAKCLGLKPDGTFPSVGESAGITSGQALSEPVVQGSLNTKHSAGQAKGKREFSGLDVITRFVAVPDDFQDRAAVAELDGVVDKVEPAPQGGTNIFVNGTKHYVLPGFAASVQVGQKVEAGEVLSDGLANPADIVRLRGLGEGRRYYAERFGKILADSGNRPDPRDVELVAKAVVDNYVIDDPDEDSPWEADSLVRENSFLKHYKPPASTEATSLDNLEGKYLQQPVLHYTVGTRVTPTMVTRMKRVGADRVLASPDIPSFRPEMQRLRTASHDTSDWLQSMGTSYLRSQMQRSLESAADTNVITNHHFGPRLAYGADFGTQSERTGTF